MKLMKQKLKRGTKTLMHGIITLLLLLSSILRVSSTGSSSTTNATDTITTAQLLRDGDTIVSAGQRFELGFFSPGSSKNRYLGIWFKSPSESESELPTVAWVANREAPLDDTSGVLKITREGVIALLNRTHSIIWSSNSSRAYARNPVAKLLDSGNLVLKEADDDDDKVEGKNFVWQSFDYPSDTLLPGMKFGRNTVTGLDRYLQSWKSRDDPAPGVFTFGIDSHGYPQYFLRMGSDYQFRMGPWNGLQFSGFPSIHADNRYKFGFVLNQEEMYFFYEDPENVLTRLVLNENGILQRMISTDGAKSWLLYLTLPMANCDIYAFCGAYTSCSNTAGCECLKGFLPNSPKDRSRNRLSGCVRRTPLGCNSSSAGGEGFLKLPSVKLPDTRNSWFNLSMSLKECETMCLKNCSCVAYANIDVRSGGSGCFLWFGDLFDITEVTQNGQDLYIRMAASELGQASHRWMRVKRILVISVVSSGTCILALAITLYIWKEQRRRKRKGKYYKQIKNGDLELPLFDLATVNSSTNNFAIKLGEGGFGPVYKGMLEGGQQIAVKLLANNSTQGVDEFKNEVTCIAKLQHRNLVKLLGCCIEKEERMLIYEYMPNHSLDTFIFDQSQRTLLGWPARFHIINGIARGLLYLHQDSRLRIVQRDLKASNILLDYDMNPKISDFGLARIFGENETEANTKRVVGTYGYMSPEYAIDGLFSVKSDVFSFGVLVLEIVSGNRNRGFYQRDHYHNLLGHAWRVYKEGRSAELVDASMEKTCNLSEVLRSIHVGLLCVQKRPDDRPNMSNVVLMLGGEGALVQPKQPGFFTERNLLEVESSRSEQDEHYSANMVTITLLGAR